MGTGTVSSLSGAQLYLSPRRPLVEPRRKAGSAD